MCRPDEKDDRDELYADREVGKTLKVTPLRARVDLREECKVPEILDQKNLGACVSNQVSNALRFCLRKLGALDFQPSRLYIYYFARLLDGISLAEDGGTSVRTGLKAVARYGAPSEAWYPYAVEKFAVQPSKQAMSAGYQHARFLKYLRVNQSLEEIKRALSDGYPVICGIEVYSSFEKEETMKSGRISMPNIEKDSRRGGHCVALYGYNDEKEIFIMMNTWGKEVGKGGWFTIPYNYILNPAFARDFWTVRFYK